VDKWTSKQGIYKHADDADSKGFSQIRKKSVVICINLCRLCAYCLNQDSQDYRMNRMNRYKDERAKGRRGERSKAQAETRLLVHSFTCPLIINHLSLITKKHVLHENK
jgi:hypothetical protein